MTTIDSEVASGVELALTLAVAILLAASAGGLVTIQRAVRCGAPRHRQSRTYQQ